MKIKNDFKGELYALSIVILQGSPCKIVQEQMNFKEELWANNKFKNELKGGEK